MTGFDGLSRALWAALALALLVPARPARCEGVDAGGGAPDEARTIDALVAEGRWLSAARFIEDRPALREDPRYVRKLTHVLVTGYALTVDFRLFSLRDLEPGEDLARVRGTPGSYVVVGGDLEQRLQAAIRAHPDDPDLQYALGEWLARMSACGCGTPELFRAEDEPAAFARAERAGVFDAWSLFRLGYHRLRADDHRAAVALFERALALDPGYVDARYDAALALLLLEDHAAARQHSAQVIGKYGDPALDADAWHVHGAIEAALGAQERAEEAYRTALRRKPGHAPAFKALLALLRAQGRMDEYQRTAASFVALDYASTYPLRVYVEYVSAAGPVEADRGLARALAARTYQGVREVGAVFYGLGTFAEVLGERAQAHAHYARALSALRALDPPPEGAIDALEHLVQRTQGE